MALRLRGSTDGYAEIDASAQAGNVTLTLPSTAGTINVKDASGNTEVGTGVTFGNPGANIFTVNNTGGERLRIAADGTVSIPGALNVSGVLTYEDVTSVDAIGLSTFRDGLNTKDVGITTISTSVSDTAVDVFVYDTSKDSDGGEWRKRTSHTSWYNETLNTSTRGSRREFPAVAVIVAEDAKVTIYDGDDPDLPMWMVFETNASDMLVSNGINAAVMLNGILSVVRNTPIIIVNFVADKSNNISPSTETNYQGNIEQRNDGLGFSGDISTRRAVANGGNDVAMTVLPNAPIDETTGLPIPTIAVATGAGVSVIKDDGTVVDIAEVSAAWSSNLVEFFDGKLIHNDHLTGTNSEDYLIVSDIPASDTNYLAGGVNYNHASTPKIVYSRTHDNTKLVSLINNTFALGSVDSTNHLTLLSHETTQSQSMVAFATTSYNTGWMHGDIKGAFLSGISTADVTGSDFITNGNFDDTDISYWTAANGATLTHQTNGNPGGNINVASGPSSNGYASRSHTVVVGKYYTLSFDHYHVDGSQGYVNIGTTTGGSEYIYQNLGTSSSWTPFSFTIKATSTNLFTGLYSRPNGNVRYDNVVLREADPDRSVNNNGLQVFGTINKSAVATGADLVAYHGVSATNYLKQPYNSDLNFGTGDFSIFVWVLKNNLSSNHYIIDRSPEPFSSTGRAYFVIDANGRHRYRLAGGAGTEVTGSVRGMPEGVYNHIGFVRKGGAMEFWMNGELVETVTGSAASASFDNGVTGQVMTVDRYANGFGSDYTFDRMALLRISGSAPTPEQIKKMYEDEKVLFQENAACTLYGSSDAVTALAYDEVTDQLHAGTSSGRSDFQGLRRINNTTQEVQTAISAHDTFIIEQ